MKKFIAITAILLMHSFCNAQNMNIGVWTTGEENTIIETYEKEDGWYGKIKSSDNSNAKIGKDILIGFVQGEQLWTGKLFAAKRRKELDAKIKPTENELIITVSAGLFSKTLRWKKVDTN